MIEVVAGYKNWKIGIDDDINARCFADTDDGLIIANWHNEKKGFWLEYEGETTDYADKWFRKWLKNKNKTVLN